MTAPRVALVVTGQLEFDGLAASLQRLFPTAVFVNASSIVKDDLVDSTSARVDPARNARDAAEKNTPKIDELIAHLGGSLCGRLPADFSVLIEDLELTNRGNELQVVQAVREAVERHLARVAQRRDGPRDLDVRLRERASFHLFDPMIETYFFDDPGALSVAVGGQPRRPVCRAAGRDPERFLVEAAADEGFFAPVGECPRHRRPKDRKCPWDGAQRGEHPKKYLKYLCREDPPYDYCSTYKETDGGVKALQQLDWSTVLSRPGSAPFLRALIEDLEDALGQAPAIQGWPASPTSAAPTVRSNAPRAPVLRNL
jgi:hypothetical protein